MKVGFKLYTTNYDYLPKLKFADFIELMAIEGKLNINKIKEHNFKYTVHIMHSNFGFNPADQTKVKQNKAKLQAALTLADELNSKIIVIHPGYTTPKLKITNGLETTLTFFEDNFDKRLHFENIIYREDDLTFFGYKLEDHKKIIRKLKFCLDFGHAINAAYKEGVEYKKFITELNKLKPNYFHMCGNKLKNKFTKDGSHLSIFDGEDDIEFYKKIIKKSGKMVCLETPLDVQNRKKEYEFMKN